MKAYINKNTFHSIDNRIDTTLKRVIYNYPLAGKLGGFAFAAIRTSLRTSLSAIGLIENIALGIINALSSAFSTQARKDFKANLINIKYTGVPTILFPIGYIVYLFHYHLQPKADENHRTQENWKPIHFAAAYNDTKSLKRLLEVENVDPNVETKYERYSTTYHETALHLATGAGNVESVELLINNLANTSIRNTYDLTPLDEAILRENLSVVKALVENGADVNERHAQGKTAMHFAVMHSHGTDSFGSIDFGRSNYKEIIDYLVGQGAEVNLEDDSGYTPLSLALNSIEAMKALLEHGADINHEKDDGQSVIFYAGNYSQRTLEFLVSRDDLNINKQDHKGKTALHYAAQKVTPDTALALSKHPRFNPNVQDEQNQTALHIAAQKIACLKGLDGMQATHDAMYRTFEVLLNLPRTNLDLVDNKGKKAMDYINNPLSPQEKEQLGLEIFGEMMWKIYKGQNPHLGNMNF